MKRKEQREEVQKAMKNPEKEQTNVLKFHHVSNRNGKLRKVLKRVETAHSKSQKWTSSKKRA